ncbi:efflux RND transporter periplasmic adaptor subunit [Halomonas sp. McH1-25]|uniref:efflux RND transporter periplasmic adaptor subunit n=1 Tax=unclassified Halomonas TaxID=2609666 RepID=UPI001EF4C7C3|nr:MULTISPECIES: efflux RND transporter periplasmic adaptor subunit [unclassified Halomonas]MCG7598465.1 efflux RND transporter periplasmic adaptor subunit [Halomonas sp. McH1-25]MCP1343454.1 efflux RND transporter periplasmic adaptor subunit [Halomonas sp. FL8]MCP1361368.1 efflux RND transporter periplasmic adaptor subunit [Halomonas sp. BBD45]MCP1364003.1 efflux RND transporter periplasmic adaptor subunit [Halomonas sp. BBD48]
MKTVVRLIVVLILLALVLGGIFGWKYLKMQEMAAQQSQPQPPVPVDSVQLVAENWRPELKSVGSMRAVNGVAVSNEVAGMVSEIAFESGQRVSQGEILVKLDDSVDQAALAALEAQARLTNETFRRYSDLLPRNAISQSQYDEAQANYQAARADVAQQRAQMDKKTIRAPFDGVVGLRQVDFGEYIAVGTPIVDLNMLDPIYVDYSVPEKQLGSIQAGRSVEVRVAAYPDEVFPGEIQAIAPAIDESSRTLEVRATLANPERKLRPGMFADVRTLASEPERVLTLPRTALAFNTYGDYVFLVTENDQEQLVAKRTQVTTGRTRGDQIEIVDGLEAGDRVVAVGQLRLRDGQPVSLVNEEGAAAVNDDQEPGDQREPETAGEEAQG